MVLAIVGGRDFANYKLLESVVNRICSANSITKIVSGGARGADSLGVKYAEAHSIPTEVFAPDYSRYGRAVTLI